MQTAEYYIPEENLEKVKAKISQINKKAVKNGLIPFQLNIGDVEVKEIKTKDKITNEDVVVRVEHWYPITISGEYPSINGWKCIAKIDHRDGVNLISIYDETDVSKYRDRKPTCDHCGHNKIKVQSYLIQNVESGEIMQIGKSCIKDYIKADPKTMLAYLQWFSNLDEMFSDEEYSGGGRVDYYYPVSTIAAISALCIRKNGWKSSQEVDSTVSCVGDFFFPPQFKTEQLKRNWEEFFTLTDDDVKVAEGMIEYFSTQSANNNFVIMVQDLLALGDIRSKFFSFIAGAVSGYLKHLDRKIREDSVNRTNEWVGEIKKRQEFTVTLENINVIDGYYGMVYIHRFLDSDGHTIIWFANGTSIDRKGETFKIKATPKKFDEYKGWKQTVVARVAEVCK